MSAIFRVCAHCRFRSPRSTPALETTRPHGWMTDPEAPERSLAVFDPLFWYIATSYIHSSCFRLEPACCSPRSRVPHPPLVMLCLTGPWSRSLGTRPKYEYKKLVIALQFKSIVNRPTPAIPRIPCSRIASTCPPMYLGRTSWRSRGDLSGRQRWPTISRERS